MIQLRKSGSVIDVDDVAQLKMEFEERQCVLLPSLLEPYLLNFVLCRLQDAKWRDMVHEDIGTEVVLDDGPSLNLLRVLANNPSLLAAVQEITGCGLITWFGGRVYRLIPNSGHLDSWHDDDLWGRLIGMSLNLSPRGYSGGIFQLRERKSKKIITEVANTGLGDATLFRISKELEHRVTDISGDEPKTAFAGWFQTGPPTLKTRLRGLIP